MIPEIGGHDGALYIAMQLLEGESLRSRMKGKMLPVEDWLLLDIPIAEGLAHAHAAGIVHRDLKPDNVMLTRDGQVNLLSFSLARLLHPDKDAEPSSQEIHTRLKTISSHAYMWGGPEWDICFTICVQVTTNQIDRQHAEHFSNTTEAMEITFIA